MIRELSNCETGVDRDYDVCIVGSGPAGLAVSSTLVRENGDLRICVLESGDVRPTETGDDLRDVVTNGLDIKTHSRERTVGGASTTWDGLSAPLDPVVFRERDGINCLGWPLSRVDLFEYYEKASRDYRFPPVTYFDGGSEARRHGFESPSWSALQEKLFLRPDELPDIRGKMLDMADADALDLFVQGTVTCLNGDPGEAEARWADVRDFSGRAHTFEARRFVLACGGIENPRVLLNSTFSCRDGLGNEEDQVGRYFMNHPKGDFGTITVSCVDFPYQLRSLMVEEGYTGYFGLRLTDDLQREEGVLNSYVRFHPISPLSLLTGPANLELRSVAGMGAALPYLLRRWPTAASMLYDRFSSGSPRKEVYGIRNFLEMEPRPDNRVVLTGETDAFGIPKAEVQYSLSELDRRSIVEVHNRLREELRDAPWGESIQLLHDGVNPWPTAGDASHHMGATRMGTDPAESVVNEHCRVHSCPNVYVAGSSVFPTGGIANPTWTIVALGIRLGEHLAETV